MLFYNSCFMLQDKSFILLFYELLLLQSLIKQVLVFEIFYFLIKVSINDKSYQYLVKKKNQAI